jgi:hypothetical protein
MLERDISMTKVGSAFGISIEVAAWDAAGANVELSCAAMFIREADGALITGGLAHLNAALDGHLLELREQGIFTAAAGECLLLPCPPGSIKAKSLLLVGMGDPADWSVNRLRDTVRAAAEFALAIGAHSAAFAPGMLDSGITPGATVGASAPMIDGLAAALRARSKLVDLGLAGKPLLQRWVFDVGAARLSGAVEQFQEQLRQRAD